MVSDLAQAAKIWLTITIVALSLAMVCITITGREQIKAINKTENAVATYKEDGGDCYVDGVRQDDYFDIKGLNWSSYTATYNDGKLYIKSKRYYRYDTSPVNPVVVPIIH